jgi:DeoR/GlpR family transcriptional regulator of sugar metabolism
VHGGALPASPALGGRLHKPSAVVCGYVVGSIEKIGTVAPYAVVGLSEVAGLVTDAPAGDLTIAQLRRQGVSVIQA